MTTDPEIIAYLVEDPRKHDWMLVGIIKFDVIAIDNSRGNLLAYAKDNNIRVIKDISKTKETE